VLPTTKVYVYIYVYIYIYIYIYVYIIPTTFTTTKVSFLGVHCCVHRTCTLPDDREQIVTWPSLTVTMIYFRLHARVGVAKERKQFYEKAEVLRFSDLSF